MDISDLAKLWREQRGYNGRGGVVVVFNNKVQGWVSDLRDVGHWQPGCIAIDERSEYWKATGGNAQDGATLWTRVIQTRSQNKKMTY